MRKRQILQSKNKFKLRDECTHKNELVLKVFASIDNDSDNSHII